MRKRGNRLGFKIFEISLKIFGLSGAYGLLYFVCLYYLVFDRQVVSSSLAYIKRRFRDYNAFERIWGVYRLLISQGKSLVDRYYFASASGQFDFEVRGLEMVKSLLNDSQKGLILLTTHTGNWQINSAYLHELQRTVYLLMRPEDNIAVKEALNIDGEKEWIKVISPENPLESVIEMLKVIDRGDIVSIMGDRSYGADVTEVDFLGAPAQFPYTAFSLAASAQCPVVVFLSAKLSNNKYLVDMSHIIQPRYNSSSKKREQIAAWVSEFAGIMENYVETYPFQWFCFQDIWGDN